MDSYIEVAPTHSLTVSRRGVKETEEEEKRENDADVLVAFIVKNERDLLQSQIHYRSKSGAPRLNGRT